ncbi:MAG: PD-(D/E)XK nuclease family protein [Clostridia bacterium]|nr:PD-(D/E)XK nuclease family protein [Clostridia bacterium]
MLTILTGGPGCGKTTRLLEQLHTLAQAGEKSLLLVPESGSHQAERRLLQVCGNRGGAFATVTTFSKLTEDVLKETGCRPVTLDPGGRVLTMHRALTQVQSSLGYFRRAPRPQLVEKLVELASELMACGVTPAQLLEQEGLSPKIRDIGIIYAGYDALCKAGDLDPAARVDLAAQRVEASGLLTGTHLFVDGFEGFTRQKYGLLEQMLCQCKTVTVALQMGADKTLYTEQRQTLERLRRMAQSRGIPVSVTPCVPVDRKRPAGLEGLAEDLFDFCAQPREGSEGLHLYTLPDPRSECELAAALLRQKALSGTRCREMAVVCGDLEGYGDHLQAAFEQYDIPLFFSTKTDVLQSPALQTALGGLRALENGLEFSDVTDWLRCGIGGLGRDEVDRLENYCFQWNIRGGKWHKPFTMPTCGYDRPADDEEEKLAAVERTRQAVWGILQPLQEALRRAAHGGEYAAAMENHLEQIDLESLLSERCKVLQQSGRGRESAETAQLYQSLLSALEQFSAVMDGIPMDTREFCKLLELTLRQYELSAIPPTLDAVQAVSFERLSSMPVRHMVIVGGREGLFPPEKASMSLLSEQERVALETGGIELTQSALERVWQQQCALCRAVAAPSHSLTVTLPRRLADGSKASPGFAFTRMGVLRGVEPQSGERLLESLRLTAPKPLFGLACAAAGGETAGPAAAALRAVCAWPENRAHFENLRAYSQNPRGPITDPELVKRLYGGQIRLTATRMDRVSTCRMSHFLQYGLRLKPRREARFGAPEIGTFLHYVVENAIPELCADESRKPEAVAAKHVNEYLERYLPKGQQEARWQALFRQAGHLACRVVKNVWEEILAGDFRPVCFELEFGPDGHLPPLELREGSLKLTVGGKIDRVDGYVRGDTLYLKVVDYKTGSKQFRLSDLLYGLNLQMFLYLMMLRQADLQKVLAATNQSAARLEPAAALYIPAKDPYVTAQPGQTGEAVQQALDKELRRIGLVLDDGDLLEAMERGGTFRFLPVDRKKDGGFTASSCVASAAQMGRLLRKTEDSLRQIARQIAAGDIEATPYRVGRDETPCRFCDFREACHFDPTLRKDNYRFLPAESPARVHEILKEEEEQA